MLLALVAHSHSQQIPHIRSCINSMFNSLKADGVVVEKVFDGRGSMIVRGSIAEWAGSLAAAEADAQDGTTTGEVGEVMTNRYAAARQNWRPAAAHHAVKGAETEPEDCLPGKRVAVVRMKAMPELEGKTGTVLEISEEPGRVIVEIDSGQKLNISLKHLQFLHPAHPADPDPPTQEAECSSEAASSAVILVIFSIRNASILYARVRCSEIAVTQA